MTSDDRELDEPQPEALSARAATLAGCVRNWHEVVSRVLCEHAPSIDDERIEFLAGYIDPYASWEAILAESAQTFPGAATRFRDITEELASLLEEVSARELFLYSAGFVLEHVQASLQSVLDELEAISDVDVSETLGELQRSMERLAVLLGSFKVSVQERRVLGSTLNLWNRKGEG